MGTRNVTNAEAASAMRDLAQESMKAGMEMGYDKAVQLVERISEAWGESQTMAAELKGFRTKVLADMARTMTDATKGGR